MDAILSHSFRRLEEEINNCVEVCHQLDTELEVRCCCGSENAILFLNRNHLKYTVDFLLAPLTQIWAILVNLVCDTTQYMKNVGRFNSVAYDLSPDGGI